MMGYKLFVLALLCVLCIAEEVKKEVNEVKKGMEDADKVVPLQDEIVEEVSEFIEKFLDDEIHDKEEDIPVEDVPEEEKEEEDEKFDDEIVKDDEEEEEAVPDQDQPVEDPTKKRPKRFFYTKSKGKCPVRLNLYGCRIAWRSIKGAKWGVDISGKKTIANLRRILKSLTGTRPGSCYGKRVNGKIKFVKWNGHIKANACTKKSPCICGKKKKKSTR